MQKVYKVSPVVNYDVRPEFKRFPYMHFIFFRRGTVPCKYFKTFLYKSGGYCVLR